MTEFLELALYHSTILIQAVDINSPSKSLKGVLLIFTKERIATKFTHDTEEILQS